MRCASCHQAITPGEDYEEARKFSASGAGIALVVHKSTCPPRPH